MRLISTLGSIGLFPKYERITRQLTRGIGQLHPLTLVRRLHRSRLPTPIGRPANGRPTGRPLPAGTVGDNPQSGTLCDLAGEVQWVRRMIEGYEGRARESGARIVHGCGFDSIPSDRGVYFLQQEAMRRFGHPCPRVKMRVRAMRKAPFAETENAEQRAQKHARNMGSAAPGHFRTKPGTRASTGASGRKEKGQSVSRMIILPQFRIVSLP